MKANRLLVLVSLTMLAACGDDDGNNDPPVLEGEIIDCTWHQDTTNCWRETLRTIDSCLDNDLHGTVSPDGSTCTDASVEATFNEPLVLPVTDDQIFDFEIQKAGKTCIEFAAVAPPSQEYQGMTVTSTAGTYSEAYIGDGLQITCPSGTKYQIPAPASLGDCGSGNYPGYRYITLSDDLVFRLLGDGTNEPNIFVCSVD